MLRLGVKSKTKNKIQSRSLRPYNPEIRNDTAASLTLTHPQIQKEIGRT